MTAEQFSEARELFFEHDGSRFYMSRNDVEQTYLDYHVPPELAAAWLSELTEDYLAKLAESWNGRALNFFLSHRDTRHLLPALASPPAGPLIDRIVYLELLAQYLEVCPRDASTADDAQDALAAVVESAVRLRRRARSERNRRRLDAALARVRAHLAESRWPAR